MLINTTQPARRAGDLDRTFGLDGVTVLEGSEVKAITVLKSPGLQQGKIVGVLRDGSDFKLFRLNKNGALDTSFGLDGYSRWGFLGTAGTSIPTGIRELSADKLLVTGYLQEGSPATQNYPAVARFNGEGTIDLLFGKNGVFVFREPSPTGLYSSDIDSGDIGEAALAGAIIPASHKLLLAFNSRGLWPYNNQGLLIQLTPNGHLDTLFNNTGYAFFQIEQQSTASVGLIIRDNGHFLVAGNSGNRGFVADFDATGTINPLFGTNGFTLFNLTGGILRLNSLLLQPDGKPAVAGSFTTTGSTVKGYVNRLSPSGHPDPDFNAGQALIVERPFVSLQLNSAELDSEQTIVVAGELNTRGLALAGRITAQGKMDSTFGIDGLTETPTEGILNYTNSVTTGDLRQVLIAGKKAMRSAVSRYLGD